MPEALKKAIQKSGNIMGDIVDPFHLTTGLGDKALSSVTQGKLGGNQGLGAVVGNQASMTTPPPILPPTRMPTSGDQQAAQRQSVIDQLRRRGRASTILTDNTDTLG
jgi:hypothetical protein